MTYEINGSLFSIYKLSVSKYLAGRIEMHHAEIAASPTEYAKRPTEAFFVQLKVSNGEMDNGVLELWSDVKLRIAK